MAKDQYFKTTHQKSLDHIPNLSGWWLSHPSEKYEFVSWDDDIPNIWKNTKRFQSTNQLWSLCFPVKHMAFPMCFAGQIRHFTNDSRRQRESQPNCHGVDAQACCSAPSWWEHGEPDPWKIV